MIECSPCARHRRKWRSGGITPHIFELRTCWRLVMSFTPRPIYLQCSLIWRLGRIQSKSKRFGKLRIVVNRFNPYDGYYTDACSAGHAQFNVEIDTSKSYLVLSLF
jgi:hypothetical protein